MIELDETDRALLRGLTRDATQSAGSLGRALGVSQPAVWRRINRLTEAGVITGTSGRYDQILKLRPPLPFGTAEVDITVAAIDAALQRF